MFDGFADGDTSVQNVTPAIQGFHLKHKRQPVPDRYLSVAVTNGTWGHLAAAVGPQQLGSCRADRSLPVRTVQAWSCPVSRWELREKQIDMNHIWSELHENLAESPVHQQVSRLQQCSESENSAKTLVVIRAFAATLSDRPDTPASARAPEERYENVVRSSSVRLRPFLRGTRQGVRRHYWREAEQRSLRRSLPTRTFSLTMAVRLSWKRVTPERGSPNRLRTLFNCCSIIMPRPICFRSRRPDSPVVGNQVLALRPAHSLPPFRACFQKRFSRCNCCRSE